MTDSHTIDLLTRRGFLIDKEDGCYYLSDNSHKEDVSYLRKILTDYKLGFVDSNDQIIIYGDNAQTANKLKNLFLPVDRGTVGVGTCYQSRKWSYHVAKRLHSTKLPVIWLEANIAAYIKSLSAIGIYTSGCCDGNHPNCYKLSIDFDAPVYSEYHRCLWEHLLNTKFKLNWDNDYRSIYLEGCRQEQYDELFRAARFIYHNRSAFIFLRFDAASWMTKNTLKHMKDDDIKERFLKAVINNLASGSFFEQ